MSVIVKQRVIISVPNEFHSYNGCTGVVVGYAPKRVCVKAGLFGDTYETQQYVAVKLDMNGPTIHVAPSCLSLADNNIRPIR